MTLKGNGWLVRWTYLFGESRYRGDSDKKTKYPATVTLCRFFWRAFFWMPLFWALVGSGAFFLISTILHNLRQSFVAAIAVATFAVYLFLFHTIDHWVPQDQVSAWVASTTFAQGVKAVKSKICPVIRIES